MQNSTPAHEQDTSGEAGVPASDYISAGNIKLSYCNNPAGIPQPAVRKLFTSVKGVLKSGSKYRYKKDSGAPVPSVILETWRMRGYDPSSTGTAVVNFLKDGKESKAYTFPLYFWEWV